MGIYKLKNANTSAPTPVLVDTISVTEGVNVYEVNIPVFLENEALAIIGPEDTVAIKTGNGTDPVGGKYRYWREGTAFWIESSFNPCIEIYLASEGIKSGTIEGISDTVDNIDKMIDSINLLTSTENVDIFKTPLRYTASIATNQRYFHYENSYLLEGKKVVALHISVAVLGSLSVYKITNKGLSNQEINLVQTLELNGGGLRYPVDIDVSPGEILAFKGDTDTGNFYYSNLAKNNGGGSIYYMNTSNNWQLGSNADIGIGVDILDKKTRLPVFNSLLKKKVSILGDSISTCYGFIPAVNSFHYPRYDVTDVSLTWWRKLIDRTGAILEVNNSWGGARIAADDPSSFTNRTGNIGNPDVLLIFGGTNDFSTIVPIGDISLTEPFDKNTFTGAYQKMLVDIQTNNKLTRIICMTPMRRGNTTTPATPDPLDTYCDRIIEICELYGIEYVDMRNIGVTPINRLSFMPDYLHPNAEGMELIANYVMAKIC